MEIREEEFKRALIVAVDSGEDSDFKYMMEEMEELIKACLMETVDIVVQNLSNPNPATYIGSGKVEELRQLIALLNIETIVFAHTLSPAQLKNLSEELDAELLDRTGLILEIFSKRAGTREARLQVESAQLNYMLPRLVGMRKSLGRQGGASGSMSNKGQGEKQIELDRRHIEKRITELNRELESIKHDRAVQRSQRQKATLPCVSLVGYTNAGKSTLMNCLISLSGKADEKSVFEKDMLFATLDTSIRRISTGNRKDFLLTDTVGFVSDLPHGLIKAFRATLEEAKYADLILIVLDASDEYVQKHKEITEKTLKEIDCLDIPHIYVMNKCDRLLEWPKYQARDEIVIPISAKSKEGIDVLLEEIRKQIYKDNSIADLLIPYSRGDLVSLLSDNADILSTEYLSEGTRIRADMPQSILGKVKEYIL